MYFDIKVEGTTRYKKELPSRLWTQQAKYRHFTKLCRLVYFF